MQTPSGSEIDWREAIRDHGAREPRYTLSPLFSVAKPWRRQEPLWHAEKCAAPRLETPHTTPSAGRASANLSPSVMHPNLMIYNERDKPSAWPATERRL
jgi:hypothetical protein